MLDGNTRIIAHLGYPTSAFKAPMIYNPYFEHIGLNAAVVPMGVRAEDFAVSMRAVFRMSNVHGALITMPHKVEMLSHLDEVSPAARIAGACNAVLVGPGGALKGDMFDGEGFVRGVLAKGRKVEGASALVVGAGGVGSAIAAAIAAAGAARLALFDTDTARMEALAGRLASHYPWLDIAYGSNAPEGFDLIVNATPLGMDDHDPMPVDISRISPDAFVGEVVMKREMTAFLAAARARGCEVQVGIDMLYAQIPAYLEFFGFPSTTPDTLRGLARIAY